MTLSRLLGARLHQGYICKLRFRRLSSRVANLRIVLDFSAPATYPSFQTAPEASWLLRHWLLWFECTGMGYQSIVSFIPANGTTFLWRSMGRPFNCSRGSAALLHLTVKTIGKINPTQGGCGENWTRVLENFQIKFIHWYSPFRVTSVEIRTSLIKDLLPVLLRAWKPSHAIVYTSLQQTEVTLKKVTI